MSARARTSAPQSGHVAGSGNRTSTANCARQPRHAPATVSRRAGFIAGRCAPSSRLPLISLHRHALDVVRQNFPPARVHDDVQRLDLGLLHPPRRVRGIVRREHEAARDRVDHADQTFTGDQMRVDLVAVPHQAARRDDGDHGRPVRRKHRVAADPDPVGAGTLQIARTGQARRYGQAACDGGGRWRVYGTRVAAVGDGPIEVVLDSPAGGGARRLFDVFGNGGVQPPHSLHKRALARVVCGRGRNPTLRTVTETTLPRSQARAQESRAWGVRQLAKLYRSLS